MEEDKVTETTCSEMDQTVKLEPPEQKQSAPDFIPLHKSPSPIPIKSEPGSIIEKNGQKRIKIETDDGNCKKRRISTPEPSIISANADVGVNISDEEYYLIVSNLPINWTYVQIKNYLDQECGHVDEMEMLLRNNSQPSAIRLTFQNKEKCFAVYKKLEDKVVEDKTIEVKMSDSSTTFPTESTEVTEQNEVAPKRCWRPDLDSWDIDPEGLYGLRPQFLKSLNITPPLTNMVHVTNFRCDKNELKEVMQLAGHVLMCCVVNTTQKYAKVMYSHPLEAVQAISMLNGQMHYGNPLKIAMDKNPGDNIILPKGLANIGVGLGTQGRPIRNIVHEYQRFIKKQTTLLSPIVFSEIDFSNNNTVKEDNSEEIQKKIDDFVNTPVGSMANLNTLKIKNIEELSQDSNSKDGSNRSTPESQKSIPTVATKNTSIGTPSPTNSITKNGSSKQNIPPLLATPALGSAPLHPLVRFGTHSGKGYVPPNLLNPPVPMHNPLPGPGEPFYRPGNPHVQEPRQFGPRPYMPMQRVPFHPQAMPGPFRPGIRPQGPPANFSGPRPVNPGNRVTVKFSNLPPSTTFPLLCEQLAQCGQVMSVQLTTPGCAVATFGHPSHADRCIQNFNGMNVEGFIIEVSFV